MARIHANTSDNVYYQARIKASKYNEMLASRDSVSEATPLDRKRMYQIENGFVAPHPEEVYLMSDLYNAPELCNYYCTHNCVLGCKLPETEVKSLDRIVLEVVAGLPKLEKMKETLLEVAEDGKVDASELNDVRIALETLNKFRKIAQNCELWVEKHVGKNFESVSSSEV